MTHKPSREITFLRTPLYTIIFTGLHNYSKKKKKKINDFIYLHNYSPGGQLKGRHTVANK